MRQRERKEKQCKYCDSPIPNRNVYCNNACQNKAKSAKVIREWKEGKVNGHRGSNYQLSNWIRNYLLEKADNRCEKCSWNKINPYTNKIPLEIDHIDGDASNNKEENLRVLCPNCHALTHTFRNTGGRVSARRGTR